MASLLLELRRQSDRAKTVLFEFRIILKPILCLLKSNKAQSFLRYWTASALQIISSRINKILISHITNISNAYKRELLTILPISTQLTALPVVVC